MTGTGKILVVSDNHPNLEVIRETAELCDTQVFVIEPPVEHIEMPFSKKEKNWKPKRFYER
jgi:hypothetical protein